MPSAKAALATLVLGGGGATAGAAMGGAFTPSKSQDSDNSLPPASPSPHEPGSALDRTEERRVDPVAPTRDEQLSPTSSGTVVPRERETQTAQDPFVEGSIGKTYSKYLISVYESENKSSETSWKEAFDRHQKDKDTAPKRTFSQDFLTEKVTTHFEAKSDTVATTTSKALNKVCEAIFKKPVSKISKPTSDGVQEQFRIRDDFWKYCSLFGETPRVILEDKEKGKDQTPDPTAKYDNKIGKKFPRSLLSTKEGNNSQVWKIKHEEVKAAKVSSKFFGNLNDATALKNKCEEAYKLETSAITTGDEDTTTKVKEKNLFKHCSIEQPIPKVTTVPVVGTPQ